VIVYRLAKAAFVGLDGEGARLYGGRWNSPGRPMTYTAQSPSLAVLEVLVHLDLPLGLMPDDYRLLAIDIPDGAPRETLDTTPADIGACPAAGDDFPIRGAALAMLAPSVIVPPENNALLNVRHVAMAVVRVVSNDLFSFAPRLIAPRPTVS
jgi:RES domain-containing protein